MFYFSLFPSLSYNWILIAAAVIPAVILMVKVYKSDRLEKESTGILWKLVIGGILSTLLAMIEERIGESILSRLVPEGSNLYNIILYFGIVAFAEETSKYIFMKKSTWNSREFNCQYDGLVYAVFTSLGFALWENINYVLTYGFSTAIVRAATAIPGHACFGVFMGVFYGAARKYENWGHPAASKVMRIFAVLMPALLHGAYDYIATNQESGSSYRFIAFIVVFFILSFIIVSRASKSDRYIN